MWADEEGRIRRWKIVQLKTEFDHQPLRIWFWFLLRLPFFDSAASSRPTMWWWREAKKNEKFKQQKKINASSEPRRGAQPLECIIVDISQRLLLSLRLLLLTDYLHTQPTATHIIRKVIFFLFVAGSWKNIFFFAKLTFKFFGVCSAFFVGSRFSGEIDQEKKTKSTQHVRIENSLAWYAHHSLLMDDQKISFVVDVVVFFCSHHTQKRKINEIIRTSIWAHKATSFSQTTISTEWGSQQQHRLFFGF